MQAGTRKIAVAKCLLSIAEIDLLEEKSREAVAAAQPIADSAKPSSSGAEAYRILALARVASGNATGARDAIGSAQALSAKDANLLNTTPITIAAGRVESALGHRREAAGLLRHAMEQAKKADTMSLILETRLAMAEKAVSEGDLTARKQITDLAADSAQRGYELFAGRAQKLLASLK